MKILGITFQTHDHGVALVEDGNILCTINEERLSRRKNDDAPPLKALEKCLKITNTSPEDIDVIVLPCFPDPLLRSLGNEKWKLIKFTKWGYPLEEKNAFTLIFNLLVSTGIPYYLVHHVIPKMKILKALKGFKGRFEIVNHHLAHAAAAYYTSLWDDCLIVLIEGNGGDYTTSINVGEKGKIKMISGTPWPHSAGQFYRLVTRMLGYNVRRHPGKITGLAAYGDPEKAYDIVKPLIWCDNLRIMVSSLIYSLQSRYLRDRKIPQFFRDNTPEDIAAAFQKRLEDVICELIGNACQYTGKRRVVLAGGVAANVKLNQKIHELDNVDEIFIHPGMGDDGLALGGALFQTANELSKSGERFMPRRLNDVYFGPKYSNNEIKSELDKNNMVYRYSSDIEIDIARLLAEGNIVARFSGRMEYGPRALGNRSVLFNTMDRTVNNWLNKKLKRAEFMPFAPSTLIEFAKKCYKNIDGSDYTAEFMTITYQCTDWMRRNSPAVVHIDNTARPQLVSKKSNPSYYKIINEYYKLTGIPSILNTSFNMHEEPIVCSPSDSIRSFLEGHLDFLAIGNYIVKNSHKGVINNQSPIRRSLYASISDWLYKRFA